MAGAGFVLGLAEFCSAAWALGLGVVESVLGASGADLLDVCFGLVRAIWILWVGGFEVPAHSWLVRLQLDRISGMG